MNKKKKNTNMLKLNGVALKCIAILDFYIVSIL